MVVCFCYRLGEQIPYFNTLYSSTCFEHYCAHHQEVKIALHSIWYRHTDTSEWSKILFCNKFIKCLYMFRALLCSSSGGQNCITQHLVSSH